MGPTPSRACAVTRANKRLGCGFTVALPEFRLQLRQESPWSSRSPSLQANLCASSLPADQMALGDFPGGRCVYVRVVQDGRHSPHSHAGSCVKFVPVVLLFLKFEPGGDNVCRGCPLGRGCRILDEGTEHATRAVLRFPHIHVSTRLNCRRDAPTDPASGALSLAHLRTTQSSMEVTASPTVSRELNPRECVVSNMYHGG